MRLLLRRREARGPAPELKNLTVIIFQRDPEWVAQCLEYDIGAQAGTLLDLLYELQRSLVGHVAISRKHGLEPFECLPRTPGSYRNRLEAREPAVISPPADFPALENLSRIAPRYFVTA